MIIAETVIMAGLCYSSSRRVSKGSEEYIICETSCSTLVQVASGKTMEGQMISDIEQIAGVCHVSVARLGGAFEVAVTMEDMEFDSFNAVVQKELALYSAFPNYTFHFDIGPR